SSTGETSAKWRVPWARRACRFTAGCSDSASIPANTGCNTPQLLHPPVTAVRAFGACNPAYCRGEAIGTSLAKRPMREERNDAQDGDDSGGGDDGLCDGERGDGAGRGTAATAARIRERQRTCGGVRARPRDL